eukprot:1164854-Prymnesium_polylepis.3
MLRKELPTSAAVVDAHITPHSIVELLNVHKVPSDAVMLKIDIDGYDCPVVDANRHARGGMAASGCLHGSQRRDSAAAGLLRRLLVYARDCHWQGRLLWLLAVGRFSSDAPAWVLSAAVLRVRYGPYVARRHLGARELCACLLSAQTEVVGL